MVSNIWRRFPFLTNIFSNGWFNHQLVLIFERMQCLSLIADAGLQTVYERRLPRWCPANDCPIHARHCRNRGKHWAWVRNVSTLCWHNHWSIKNIDSILISFGVTRNQTLRIYRCNKITIIWAAFAERSIEEDPSKLPKFCSWEVDAWSPVFVM